jgi:hypothetical protein
VWLFKVAHFFRQTVMTKPLPEQLTTGSGNQAGEERAA